MGVVTTPGKTLRKFRRDADITQRALAALLGITDSAVSEWERDQSTPGRALAAGADEALRAGGAVLAAFGYSAVTQPADDVSELRRIVGAQALQLAALTQRVQDLDAGMAQLKRAARQAAARSH